jgi:uncharacterized protein YoxC
MAVKAKSVVFDETHHKELVGKYGEYLDDLSKANESLIKHRTMVDGAEKEIDELIKVVDDLGYSIDTVAGEYNNLCAKVEKAVDKVKTDVDEAKAKLAAMPTEG